MASVGEHYAQHLAPIYVWMAGGFDAALARGAQEIDALCSASPTGLTAVDLGCGFGMHTIPLARRGVSVLAVDSSALLLDVLRAHAGALSIRAVEDDLLEFERHLTAKADIVLCMGDTLTHLADRAAVEQLLASAARSLQTGGRFIATFRDYTTELAAEKRFIPVRSDGDRILTCFLEYAAEHVTVHDVLHERDGTSWKLRVSAYQKLRLSPSWVAKSLDAQAFTTGVEPGPGGMVRIVATRC